MNVGTVIRLNHKSYDENIFKKYNIKHYDLYFPDGSTPSDEIVERFFEICEKEKDKAIAIHCKAGLGRTGTLIGLYAMKNYHFPAKAFIGYIRMVRPGSILGP
jgi:cell division cycle 14